jgi:hypothetical protein
MSGLSAAKDGRARLRPSRGGRTKHGSDGASPYRIEANSGPGKCPPITNASWSNSS